MEQATLARPYAEAVFSLAKQDNRFDGWSEVLQFAATVLRDANVKAIIEDPRSKGADVERFVLSLFERYDEQARNFLRLLLRNDRIGVIGEIAALYEELRAEHEGVVQAEITSAFPMTPDQVAQIVKNLEARYKRKVEPVVREDRELIGGASIKLGDVVIDTSVRAQLQEMTAALLR